MCCVFFFKQKTSYEMRISDWSSDVCSSDLQGIASTGPRAALDSLISTIAKAWPPQIHGLALSCIVRPDRRGAGVGFLSGRTVHHLGNESMLVPMTVKTPTLSTQRVPKTFAPRPGGRRSDEHTSELQ